MITFMVRRKTIISYKICTRGKPGNVAGSSQQACAPKAILARKQPKAPGEYHGHKPPGS
jgi:hypothetical protein